MTKWAKTSNHESQLVAARKKILAHQRENKILEAKLAIAYGKLASEKEEKGKRSAELGIANKEKKKRAAELNIANKELVYQDEEKEKRADELILANKELGFQNREKAKRATELVQLSSMYKMLYDTVADVIYVISPESGRFKFTSVNKAFETITGIPMDSVIGKYADEVGALHGLHFAVGKYEEAIRLKKMILWEETFDYLNRRMTAVVSVLPIFDEDENCINLIGNLHDITDRKRVEEEIRKINEDLDQKVTERTSQIELINQNLAAAKIKAEQATQIAEDAVRSKQQFLSNMSHEIRTPMNAIIGFTRVVLKTNLSAKQTEYLTAIKISGDAMISLINDILDLAKVDAGKMTFERKPFKIFSSISAMLHLFDIKIQEKNLVLQTTFDKMVPEILIGDPTRLHQIILNLVSNAVKFTSRGRINFGVRLVSQDEQSVNVEFTVSDTGIGISKTNLGKIFQTFVQASSETTRLYGGTGLGLAIVKQLVESQDGTIKVKSKIDKGSVFSFTLRFQKAKASDVVIDEEVAEITSKTKDIKILVVEDMPLNQLLLKTLLDDFGFKNDTAANGKIAIRKLKQKSYDVILMDLQMPVMNGFQTTRYIRTKLKLKIPIIALTADVTTVDLAKCKNAGISDYLAKPVDENKLFAKIVRLTKRNETHRHPGSPQKKTGRAPRTTPRCIDMKYLNQLTKSDSTLMLKMISIYLDDTPPLMRKIKLHLSQKNWKSMQVAMHKMIPTFDIVGINKRFKYMAKQINEYIRTQETDGIAHLVLKLDAVCTQACAELTRESRRISDKNN